MPCCALLCSPVLRAASEDIISIRTDTVTLCRQQDRWENAAAACYSRRFSPDWPYPILSCPILSYPILSYPILSCSVLSSPILSYSVLSCLLALQDCTDLRSNSFPKLHWTLLVCFPAERSAKKIEDWQKCNYVSVRKRDYDNEYIVAVIVIAELQNYITPPALMVKMSILYSR